MRIIPNDCGGGELPWPLWTTEDDDLFIFADDDALDTDTGDDHIGKDGSSAPPWTILVVDDEPAVISVTELALRRFSVDERPMRLISARSAAEARNVLSDEDNVAVIVTDVVMETEDAGLALTHWVREQKQFDATRLVIRTGQPGMAPEESILALLEINDYWPKTEISAHRMRTILTGLIRSFRDIRLVEEQHEQLREMQRQLFEQERLKVLGELVSGIAHDFNNALTPITAYASILLDDEDIDVDERREFLEIILTAGRDAAALIQRLRAYYKPGGADVRHALSAARLLTDTAALARSKKEDREIEENINIQLSHSCPDDLFIDCHEPELRQAVLNLVINAIDAVSDGGQISLTGTAEGADVILKVSDNGAGMAPEVLKNCRDAFFSTKGEKGTGLGLAMVSRTIDEHGGRFEIESTVGQGTVMTVVLPASTGSDRTR